MGPSIDTPFEVTQIASGGDGVGRCEGLVVFTPRTAPGDLIRAEVRVTGRVGRGVLQKVERAGPGRVAPECAHYEGPDRCGGCQLQHIDIAVQREAKCQMVRDAMQRIGKREVALPEIHGGSPWRYRRSLTLAIRRDEGGRAFAGLRAFDDPEAVFAMNDCLITEERVVGAWREILAAAEHLPAADRMRGTVRWVDEHAAFVLEGGTEWEGIDQFLQAVPSIVAVWWQADGQRRRLVVDRRVGVVPGASFAQVNAPVAERMQADVVARVLAHAPASVVDAYSGTGATAIALAAAGVRVTAIELDEEATAWAATLLPPPSRAIAARVEDLLPRTLPADVVILNPPRAGVDARVTTVLEAAARERGSAAPRAILYVSCDAATLARDVSRLPGWRIHALSCYDLFPQTAHVETVCELRPGTA